MIDIKRTILIVIFLSGFFYDFFGQNFIVNTTIDIVDAIPGDGFCDDGSGNCSLRAAIQESNAIGGTHIITLPTGIYVLSIVGVNEDTCSTGDLDILTTITINGVNPSGTVISGDSLDRVFHVLSTGTLNLNLLSVTEGYVNIGHGGGILNHGTLNLNNVHINNNSNALMHGAQQAGGYGGGIANFGLASMNNSTVFNNSAVGGKGANSTFGGGGGGGSAGIGGGLFNDIGGDFTIVNSTISNNVARGGNGGRGSRWASGNLYGNGANGAGINGGNGGVANGGVGQNATGFGSGGGGGASSKGNGGNGGYGGGGGCAGGHPWGGGGGTGGGTGGQFAGGSNTHCCDAGGGGGGGAGLGGGIFVKGGTVKTTNVTIAYNQTFGGNGGGYYHKNGQNGQGVGAGVFRYGGILNINNTLISNNVSQNSNNDAYGNLTSTSGHNLIFDPGTVVLGGVTTGNILSSDPYISPLANNGGFTNTIAISVCPNSPAIDAAQDTVSPLLDQRSTARFNTFGGTTISDIGAYESTDSIAVINFTGSVIDTCGAMLGQATVFPSGGKTPYTFQWDANAANQTTQTATNLTTGNYLVSVSDSNGCNKDTTFTIVIKNSYNLIVNDTICWYDSVLIGGSYVSTNGTYYDSMTTVFGCDSLFQTNLYVKPQWQDTTFTRDTICYSDSIYLGGNWVSSSGIFYDTLVPIVNCDSLVQTSLYVIPPWQDTSFVRDTICWNDSIHLGGNWVSASGIYYDTLIPNVNCDSLIQTSLYVTPAWRDTTFLRDTICWNDSIYLGGSWVSTSGVYYDTLVPNVNCDSLVQIALYVIPAWQDTTFVSDTICWHDSIYLGGNWVSASGVYYDTLVPNVNCDSLVQTSLYVTPAWQDTTFVSDTICWNDSIYFGGSWVSTSGIYYDRLVPNVNCDSLVQTALYVTPAWRDTTFLRDTICWNDSIYLGGSWVSSSGIYYDTLVPTMNCDSLVQTVLYVIPAWRDTSFVSDTICWNDSIYLGGSWVSASGIFYDTLVPNVNCDSLVQTSLYVIPPWQDTSFVRDTICWNDSIHLGGNWVSSSGVYYDTLVPNLNCDSLVQTSLYVTPAWRDTVFLRDTICWNDSIYLGGSWVSSSGIYYDTLVPNVNCDSLVQTTLYLKPKVNVDLGEDTSFCTGDVIALSSNLIGESYLWQDGSISNSINVSDSGLYYLDVTLDGCVYRDSILTSLFPLPIVDLGFDLTACFITDIVTLDAGNIGSFYLWNDGSTNQTLTVFDEGVYGVRVTTMQGCSEYDEVIVNEQCPSNIFIPNSFTPNDDGINDFLIQTGFGIDSEKYLFQVYNRWGELLFQTTNQTPWDGKYKGENVPDGVYVWKVTYKELIGQEIHIKRGHVILTR